MKDRLEQKQLIQTHGIALLFKKSPWMVLKKLNHFGEKIGSDFL